MLKPIPNKRYFSIREVSELCQVKPHVLRYWEQVFHALRPKKRGNRRYYLYKEVQLVQKIRTLLYDELFTIKGANAILKKQSQEVFSTKADESDTNVQLDSHASDTISPPASTGITSEAKASHISVDRPVNLQWLRQELSNIRTILEYALMSKKNNGSR